MIARHGLAGDKDQRKAERCRRKRPESLVTNEQVLSLPLNGRNFNSANMVAIINRVTRAGAAGEVRRQAGLLSAECEMIPQSPIGCARVPENVRKNLNSLAKPQRTQR